MTRGTIKRVRSGTALAVGILAALAGTALAGGEVGTPAPDFTLEDLDEVIWTLSDLDGQVVFLSMIGYG